MFCGPWAAGAKETLTFTNTLWPEAVALIRETVHWELVVVAVWPLSTAAFQVSLSSLRR
jgi:hypothetical protein